MASHIVRRYAVNTIIGYVRLNNQSLGSMRIAVRKSPILRKAVLLVSFSVFAASCGLFGGDDGSNPRFRSLDTIAFEFDRMSDGSTDLRLEASSAEEGSPLSVRDSLRLLSGVRYRVTFIGNSSDAQAYLSSSGPPAALVFQKSPAVDTLLELESVFGSISVQPLSKSPKKSRKTKNAWKGAELAQSADAAVPFAFELAIADTGSASGSLRLRLERYRDEGANEPDHVDFDVEIPIRVVKQ